MDPENLYSFYLFTTPSFLEGVARIIDIGSTLDVYNESKTEKEADFIALRNDWLAIGSDLRKAIELYRDMYSKRYPLLLDINIPTQEDLESTKNYERRARTTAAQ